MELVLWLQENLDWLTPVMRAITHLGDEEFYLLAFPLLYWCLSPRLGARLGVILLLSSGLNAALKLATITPRPYWTDGSIVPGAFEDSFGVPSGHAQNGVAFWGLLAHHIRRRWAWALAVGLVLALGFSRLHLGVHFPVDVVTGWALGLVLLLLFVRLEQPVTAWLGRLGALAQVGVAVAVGGLLMSLGLLALATQAGYVLPPEWLEGAAAAGQADLDPRVLAGVATPAGALTGLGIGLVLLRAGGGFAVAATWWKVAARYPVGIAGVLVLWMGLGAVFPSGELAVAVAARLVRYAAIGAWISGLAPLLFVRLRLASPAPIVTTPAASADR